MAYGLKQIDVVAHDLNHSVELEVKYHVVACDCSPTFHHFRSCTTSIHAEDRMAFRIGSIEQPCDIEAADRH